MTENYFGKTDTGKVRDNNEDTFIAEKMSDEKLLIACVIDGVGGYSGGEIAAEIARKSILEHFIHASDNIIPMMKESFNKANDRIQEAKLSNPDHRKMACVLTLAIADLNNNMFYYAHVGDTRLYLLRDHSLIKVSTDHSFVGFLEESGRLTEEAAMRHPKRNEINKALGMIEQTGKDDFIETGESPFLPGDILMLCSDGLTDLVDKKQMTAILIQDKSLEEKCSLLIDAANANGGNDNITVVLVLNDKSSVKQSATRPSQSNKQKGQPENLVTEKEKPDSLQQIGKTGPVKKQGRMMVTILSVLCLLFLTSFLWMLWNNHTNKEVKKERIKTIRSKNPAEIKLQAAINNLQGDSLILSDSIFGQSVLISDTIFINRDSLYIKTKGKLVLKRDRSYTGPAFFLSNRSRNIVLDSLTFQDFNTAIASPAGALVLKNTRFNNCRVPVQIMQIFPKNKYVTGQVKTSSYVTDSIPAALSK